MSQGPDHARWADSSGAYLLSALEEDERQDFEAHLEHCPACRQEVADLQVATDALPLCAEPRMATPALRDRIMAVVDAEAELLAAAAGPRADLPEPRPEPRARRRFGFGSVGRPALALACAAALMVLGGLGGALLRDGEGDPARTVAAEVDRGAATGNLVVGEDASRLELARLPQPPDGRVYQVWTLREGEDPTPLPSLFVPRADGTASVAVPGSLDGVDQVLVSDEPAGGSAAPTSEPFLSARPGAA